MRISNWNPQKYDGEFANASQERLKKAAEVIAAETRNVLRSRPKYGVGTISRPVYRTGKYAGEEWTAREPGALLKTIRVVELNDPHGAEIWRNRNVRVYAGNKKVYYAKIVEYHAPYLRKALNKSKNRVREILENG